VCKYVNKCDKRRPQWPRGLRCVWSWTARTQGSWGLNPARGVDVCRHFSVWVKTFGMGRYAFQGAPPHPTMSKIRLVVSEVK
jgi:hypothetical protein